MGFSVTGHGLGAPARVVTNHDLEATLDTNDEWIRSRSGIAERRWVTGDETTASLAAEAVVAALKAAGRSPEEAGLLVLATCTPDQLLPPTAPAVCELAGLRCGSFDLNGACSGFVETMIAATGLVASATGPIVVVGADRMSATVDPADRTTAVLFGDGAGALVLEPGDGELLGWHAGSDGSLRPLLEIPDGKQFMYMDGGEIFRRAVRVAHDSATAALARAGLSSADVDLYVPHQANSRIIEATRTRLGLEPEQVAMDVDRWGNTSSASVAIALAEAIESGRVHRGDIVLLSGFGAGMTWASAVLRWA